MNKNLLNSLLTLAVASALALPAAQAKETVITREGNYTTSKGGSGTTQSTTTRSKGTVNRQGSWTNAQGGTGTWGSTTQWTKGTGTASVSGSATRPNGATTTWQGTDQRVAPGQITGGGTITQANGKTDTYAMTDTKVAPGTWDKNTVVTLADGKQVDKSVQTSVVDGQGTRVTTVTGPNGQVATRDASFTRQVTQVPGP
jgi:hypothetical protein